MASEANQSLFLVTQRARALHVMLSKLQMSRHERAWGAVFKLREWVLSLYMVLGTPSELAFEIELGPRSVVLTISTAVLIVKTMSWLCLLFVLMTIELYLSINALSVYSSHFPHHFKFIYL